MKNLLAYFGYSLELPDRKEQCDMNKDKIIKLAELYKQVEALQKQKQCLLNGNTTYYIGSFSYTSHGSHFRKALEISVSQIETIIDQQIDVLTSEIESLGGCV